MAKTPRKSWENHMAQFPKIYAFVGQKPVSRHCCIQNVKDGIHIGVYEINKEKVTHSSQFISVEVKEILRKSQAQFRYYLRELWLM